MGPEPLGSRLAELADVSMRDAPGRRSLTASARIFTECPVSGIVHEASANRAAASDHRRQQALLGHWSARERAPCAREGLHRGVGGLGRIADRQPQETLERPVDAEPRARRDDEALRAGGKRVRPARSCSRRRSRMSSMRSSRRATMSCSMMGVPRSPGERTASKRRISGRSARIHPTRMPPQTVLPTEPTMTASPYAASGRNEVPRSMSSSAVVSSAMTTVP